MSLWYFAPPARSSSALIALSSRVCCEPACLGANGLKPALAELPPAAARGGAASDVHSPAQPSAAWSKASSCAGAGAASDGVDGALGAFVTGGAATAATQPGSFDMQKRAGSTRRGELKTRVRVAATVPW